MVPKRIAAPVTASALILAGLVTAGSATNTTHRTEAPQAPDALLAASAVDAVAADQPTSDKLVGLVPAAPEPPRKLRALTPPADGMFNGTVPLQDIALPGGAGVLGIPEIVLAAYRNAELALESSMPGCGLSWNLLAGIGRIESGHASNGRTDAAGTTVTPIYGPALDGTLPGNEIIKAADGGYVRALGPMQFLPGTWALYAADGNGDGVSDPHNVFDAALAAGKYLCSGNMNLRDQQQQLRAVLRYNNSMSYAAQVLSWSHAYRTGGAPTQVSISPDLIAPGSIPTATVPDMTLANNTLPTPSTAEQPPSNTVAPQQTPTQVMITIPGLPPIPCGIFCPPPPPNPCAQEAVPAPMPDPMDAANAAPEVGKAEESAQPDLSGQQFGPDGRPLPTPASCTAPEAAQPPQPAPQPQAQPQPENPVLPTESAPPAPAEGSAPAPAEEPAAPPAPAITLPFGITIPLPPPPPAPAP